jgi:hypothetical protein
VSLPFLWEDRLYPIRGGEDGGLNGSVSINVERKGMRSYKDSQEATSEGSITAYRDSSVTLNAEADEGYRVQYWKVDGSIVRENGTNIKSSSYTFSNLKDNHTVSVQFEKIGTDSTYGYIGDTGSGTITGTVGGLPVDESFILLKDATVVLTAFPSSGYKIDKWTENGNDVAESTNTYSYTSIDGLGVDIRVHFVQVDYEIKFGADNNGSVTAAVNGSSIGASPSQIRGGTEITFTAVPNQGYTLDRWEVDGVIAAGETGNEFTWTVPNAYSQKSFTIKAYFKSGTYNVSYEAGDNGIVSATLNGNIFDSGSTAAGNLKIIFTAVANEGYVVDKWLVNDIEVTGASGNVYNHIVRGNETVKVEFTRMGYPITFSANTGGTLTAESGGKNILSGAPVSGGKSVSFTASANEGYYIKAWYVDNVKIMVGEVPFTGVFYEIPSVTKAVNVRVEYEINSYMVNFSLGTASEAMGSITAKVDGTQVVDGGMVGYGKTIVFTVTPQTGYIVKSRNIDGNIIGSETNPLEENIYTHIVKGNVTVEVDLMPIPYYEVTFTKEGSGTVTSSLEGTNSSSVIRHGSITLTAEHGPYYMFKEWQIDGIKQDGKSNVITINDIKKNMTVKAVFVEAVSYKVSMVVEGDGGTISAKDDGVTITHEPDGYVPVAGDSEVVFTAAPSSGNMVKEWKINTVTQQELGNILTIPELKKDVIVSVSYEPIKIHNIKINETAGGSISVISYIPEDYRSGKSIRDRGSIIFTVTPDEGYITTMAAVYGLEVDPTSENNGNKIYTVDNITSDIEISAEFEKTSYKVTFAQQKGGRLTAKLEDGTTVSNGDSLPAGSKVIFSISLENNYEVVKWKVNGADAANTSANFRVTLSGNTNVAVVLKYTGGSGDDDSPGGGGGGGSSGDKDSWVESSSGEGMVSPSAGGQISLGSEASITIPASALKGSAKVNVKIKRVDSLPDIPGGFMVLGQVFELTVGGHNSYTFNKPVTLEFTFDPAQVPEGTAPALYYYDETTSKWIELGGTVLGNTISVTIDHFTLFVVMCKTEGASIPQPIVPLLSDIGQHWAKATIEILVGQGIVSGYTDGTFRPDNTITRAEFATLLVKVLKLEGTGSGRIFADTASHWARDTIAIAESCGIVSGYVENTFGPNDPITREQMAIMAVKAVKFTSVSEEMTFIDNTQISSWAKSGVSAAVKNGIMSGYPNNTFKPQGTATRAEAVTVIYNLLLSIGKYETTTTVD